MKQKVLVIGSGGREHALVWKLAQSGRVEKIFVAPGNGGTSSLAENVAIGVTEFEKLAEFVQNEKIDITIVGPDDPLAEGIVNFFQSKGLRIWGPSKLAAQLESSKAFAKQLMQEQNVPTAEFRTFDNFDSAIEYVNEKGVPIVIKASGLALGKGVMVCRTLDEAKDFLTKIFVDKIFGKAGSEVVIEEFLQGQEISIHAFCDGKNYSLLPTAQDHKPIFDGGLGPNTGGMGTIAPVPWVTPQIIDVIKSTIIEPTLGGLEKKGSPFVGMLYPGLMVTKDGPKVLEYNARFGDPETQSYMRLLKTDLLDIFDACIDGTLSSLQIEWHSGFACCVVLASGGYPENYEKGKIITGIEQAEEMDGVVVFHAGTKTENHQLLTNGGRVLGVTATGETLQVALDKAYRAIKLISFEGMHYRTDIGAKTLTMIKNEQN